MTQHSVDNMMRVLREIATGAHRQKKDIYTESDTGVSTTEGNAGLLPFFRSKQRFFKPLHLQYTFPINHDLCLLMSQALAGDKQAIQQIANKLIAGEVVGPELKNCIKTLAVQANRGNVPACKIISIVRYKADRQICQAMEQVIKSVCIGQGSFKALRDWKASFQSSEAAVNLTNEQRPHF